jgi:hypothetical protein
VDASAVQTSLSSQSALVGHLPGPLAIVGSQSSPASSSPLPQTGTQSLSTSEDAPGGQQPSVWVRSGWTAVCAHCT